MPSQRKPAIGAMMRTGKCGSMVACDDAVHKQVACPKHEISIHGSLLVFMVATMATASVLASIEANNAACGHCQPRVCSWKRYSMTGMSSAQLPATTKNARDMQCSATCTFTLRDKRCSRFACSASINSQSHLSEKEEVKLDSSIQKQRWEEYIEKQLVWLDIEPQCNRVAQASQIPWE